MSAYTKCPQCGNRVPISHLAYHQKARCPVVRAAREAEKQAKREAKDEARRAKVASGGYTRPYVKCGVPECKEHFYKRQETHRTCSKSHGARLRRLEEGPAASMARRKCATEGCGKEFQPTQHHQETCSKPCRRVYDAQQALAADEEATRQGLAKELAVIRRGEAEVARQAEAALARLKSPEENLRLWALCLDVPALAA